MKGFGSLFMPHAVSVMPASVTLPFKKSWPILLLVNWSVHFQSHFVNWVLHTQIEKVLS